jgi:6-pyruvoyl-tetrahydropterin synthase
MSPEGSVRHTTTVTVPFEAGHQIDNIPGCMWSGHGHRWTVAVSVEGTLDTKTMFVVDYYQLLDAVREVVHELRNHSLNDMLPGVRPTPEGLAIYFHERLSLQFPRIVTIEVGMGDEIRSRVQWDLR